MAQQLSTKWPKDLCPEALVDLHDQLNQLPMPLREKLQPLCERLGVYFSRLQTKLVHIAHDTIDQVQLDFKYLQYDLETTRRERDALREALDALEDEQDPPSCRRYY